MQGDQNQIRESPRGRIWLYRDPALATTSNSAFVAVALAEVVRRNGQTALGRTYSCWAQSQVLNRKTCFWDGVYQAKTIFLRRSDCCQLFDIDRCNCTDTLHAWRCWPELCSWVWSSATNLCCHSSCFLSAIRSMQCICKQVKRRSKSRGCDWCIDLWSDSGRHNL